MKLILELAVLFYVLFTVCGCIKVPQPCGKHYAFEFPITVTSQDTFVVGDTIWWEMDISSEILDHNSGKYIDLANFDLFFSFGMEKLDTMEPVTGNGHIHLFNPVVEVGELQQNTNGLVYTYLLPESNENKQFKVGFIPTDTGSFAGSVSFPAFYYNMERGRDGDQLYISDSACRETITYNSKIEVNDKDVNYYLMEGICRSSLDGIEYCYDYHPDSLPNYNIYAFHVKEP